jgi:hypothetical protein
VKGLSQRISLTAAVASLSASLSSVASVNSDDRGEIEPHQSMQVEDGIHWVNQAASQVPGHTENPLGRQILRRSLRIEVKLF